MRSEMLGPVIMMALLVLFVRWARIQKRENFTEPVVAYNADVVRENPRPMLPAKKIMPWEHHPLQDSLPLDLKVQYPKAYYNEANNDEYEQRLREQFVVPCNKVQLAANTSTWMDYNLTGAPAEQLVPLYESVISYVQTQVRKMDINQRPVQVVHDRWLACRKGFQKDLYLFSIELLLYRPFKYHGKHVRMDVMVETNKIYVVSLSIIGEIFEDKIALFPVIAFDPDVPQQQPFEGNTFTAEPSLLLDQVTIEKIVEQVNKNYVNVARTKFQLQRNAADNQSH